MVAQRVVERQAATRPAPGPPPLAFSRAAIAAQAKAAPGRPPLVHQAAQVAQRFGGSDSFEIDPAQIGLARSGGRTLPQAVLAKMEAAFGADFSAVRVHVGPQASRVGAVAFTMGDDVYFAPGKFQPDSLQGQQLIGHELAHVIQQRQGRVPAPGSGITVVQDRALEAEADRLGMRAASHVAPPVQMRAARGVAEATHRHGASRTAQRALTTLPDEPFALILQYLGYEAAGLLRGMPASKEALRIQKALRATCKSLKLRLDAIFDFSAPLPQGRDSGRQIVRTAMADRDLSFRGVTLQHSLSKVMWGIHDTARTLCQSFPPNDCVYISLGNSPAPVTVYIQRSYPNCKMIHIPITGLVPGYSAKVAHYARRMLAPLPRQRPWVVVDISASGASLAAIKLIIENFPMQERPGNISYVAINKLTDQEGPARLEYADEDLQSLLQGTGFNNDRILKIRQFSAYQQDLANALTDAFAKSDPFGLRLYRTLQQADVGADDLQALMNQTKDVPGIALLMQFLAAVERLNRRRGGLDEAWEYDASDRVYY